MAANDETRAFSERLRAALSAQGVRLSPTVVAHEFNLRFWGRSITAHTARTWLLGVSIPTQDKLRVLADWLQVSPDELRFGPRPGVPMAPEVDGPLQSLSLPDREMLSRYLALPVAERKLVRDVVEAVAVASQVRAVAKSGA